MRQTIKEGLDLAQELAALPFRAARQLFREGDVSRRPLGEVLIDSLRIGEGLARLPFKATAALVTEMTPAGPSLEERVAALERQVSPPAEPPATTAPELPTQ